MDLTIIIICFTCGSIGGFIAGLLSASLSTRQRIARAEQASWRSAQRFYAQRSL